MKSGKSSLVVPVVTFLKPFKIHYLDKSIVTLSPLGRPRLNINCFSAISPFRDIVLSRESKGDLLAIHGAMP